MPQYTVKDEQSGKTITFDWAGAEPPTDADMEEVFAAAGASEPTPDERPIEKLYREKFGAQTPEMRDEMERFDRGRDAALPGSLATVGGMFGGMPGAALGAYAGSRALGKDIQDSAVSGAMNALIPKAVEKGIGLVGRGIQSQALPLVRRATKPAVAFLRRRAGIEGTTPNVVGNRIGRTILEGGFKSADDATNAATAAGKQVDDVIAAAERENPNLVLDTAERIPRYLNALLRKVEGQITPGRDRTAIQNFGRELVKDSPLSARTGSTDLTNPTLEVALERIAREAMNQGKSAGAVAGKTGPSASYASSRPRALRTDVKPSEGTAIVRNKSFFDKDASASSMAAGKTTERAVRDAVKQAVPATRPILRRQGDAMDAAQVLDAMATREGARDALGLTGAIGFSGSNPVLGLVAQILRNNQLRAGHLANTAGGAMQRNADSPGIAALVRAFQNED